ncbi:XdhC family protein [Paenibacillus pabuli]|uniref:XdhC family protein n=1 Tax=Paenibacillus pabuli TaxID=1472 RepID=UPI0032420039
MEMHDLCAIAAGEARCVLATAVKVEGHAYRKQGVSMLLTEDGRMYGSISPGCLESDLQARVKRVLDTEHIAFAEYDMRPEDDLSWGETIGCGGLVVVLLEPVCGELRTVLTEMHACFESGSAAELTRYFQNKHSRVQYGWNRVKPIDRKLESALCLSLVTKGKKSAEAEFWNLPVRITAMYTPKPRLIIVGAGNDAIPVARLAKAAGFRVIVADWREGLCTSERFPNAHLVLGFPSEIMSVLDIHRGDYLILMSHQFPREREFLELLSGSEYAYLGIMGSKTRTARLLNELPPLPHLHSPVGLSIGADGPEEIAISIASELVACKRAALTENRLAQRGNTRATNGHSACSR